MRYHPELWVGTLDDSEAPRIDRHVITSTGRVRDMVCYSILQDEWPEVKARLEKRMGREELSGITALRTTD
jgi:hypothetical protein